MRVQKYKFRRTKLSSPSQKKKNRSQLRVCYSCPPQKKNYGFLINFINKNITALFLLQFSLLTKKIHLVENWSFSGNCCCWVSRFLGNWIMKMLNDWMKAKLRSVWLSKLNWMILNFIAYNSKWHHMKIKPPLLPKYIIYLSRLGVQVELQVLQLVQNWKREDGKVTELKYVLSLKLS